MDNRDIHGLCNCNVAYELPLARAINRGALVPFHYCGIYDESVDYDEVAFAAGHYDIEQLEQALSQTSRADLIFEHYRRVYRPRALAFCAGIDHAEYMAAYFNTRGIKARAVHSKAGSSCSIRRDEAVQQLKNGQLEIIFNVDIFNEGVDIPEVELVLFLRPTESYTVFLQQLGRGLRQVTEGEG